MSAEAALNHSECCSFTPYILRENNFKRVCYWLNELAGRDLNEFERFTVQSRLASCADQLKFTNVNHYIEYLAAQTCDYTLPCWQTFLDVLLETESWFRRESKHFNFLKQVVFPSLSNEISVLCAGCGDGAEAFDIAFECAEFYGFDASWNIDAIDVRSGAIVSAKHATWQEEDCNFLPEILVDKYFQSVPDGMQVTQSIRERIAFSCENLLNLACCQKYDLIFCRNLLIDMDKSAADRVLLRLMSALKPEGFLFVSHHENIRDCIAAEYLLTPNIVRKL